MVLVEEAVSCGSSLAVAYTQGFRTAKQYLCHVGALVVLAPQTKLQAPLNGNMKHYKSLKFLSKFQNAKLPCTKCKALLLKTFWQRFCCKVLEIADNKTQYLRLQTISATCTFW